MTRSPNLGFVLGAVAAWVVLVTVLHVAINGRAPLAPGGGRTLQVGRAPGDVKPHPAHRQCGDVA